MAKKKDIKNIMEAQEKIKIKRKLKIEMRRKLKEKYPAMIFTDII